MADIKGVEQKLEGLSQVNYFLYFEICSLTIYLTNFSHLK